MPGAVLVLVRVRSHLLGILLGVVGRRAPISELVTNFCASAMVVAEAQKLVGYAEE